MRRQKRNQRPFYYALFAGKVPIVDEYGNQSGEFEILYGDPIPHKANISPARGESEINQFGELLDFDKTLKPDDSNIPIDESSILWVENLDTSKPHDYTVARVGRSINECTIAIRRVDVSVSVYAISEPSPINLWNDTETWNDSDIWND